MIRTMIFSALCASLLGCSNSGNPILRYGQPTPIKTTAADGLRNIALEFLALPRPLVASYRFHAGRTYRKGINFPGEYITIEEGATYEPILNPRASSFLSSHYPTEIAAALWAFQDDPKWNGDVAALLGSVTEYRAYWASGDTTPEERAELQRKGNIMRGEPWNSYESMIESDSGASDLPPNTIAATLARCFDSVARTQFIDSMKRDAERIQTTLAEFDSLTILYTFCPILDSNDMHAIEMVSIALGDASPLRPNLLPREDETFLEWNSRLPDDAKKDLVAKARERLHEFVSETKQNVRR